MFDSLFARSGLSFDRLRALCLVAEKGGIAKAVGKDPGRQSLVSRQLKELEEFFEVELTRREGKGLTLTPAGRALAEIAKEHLLALSGFAESHGGAAPRFHLGGGDSVLQWHVIPRLAPSFPIQVTSLGPSEVFRALDELRIDFGVVRSAPARQLASAPLGPITYALYVPRKLLGEGRRSARSLLQSLPLALPSADDAFSAWLLAQDTFSSDAAFRCETFTQAARAVESGRFAAILPTLAKSTFSSKAVLEVQSPLFEALGGDLHLVWNARLLRLRGEAERARKTLLATLRL